MRSSDTKLKVVAVVLALTAAYTTGRYTAGPAVKASVVTDTVKDTDTTKVTTTTETPSGKTTTITEHTTTTLERTSKTKSETTLKPKWNVSALASIDLNRLKGDIVPSYGLHVSKEVFGSITAGGYVMDNGTIGLSLGFDF